MNSNKVIHSLQKNFCNECQCIKIVHINNWYGKVNYIKYHIKNHDNSVSIVDFPYYHIYYYQSKISIDKLYNKNIKEQIYNDLIKYLKTIVNLNYNSRIIFCNSGFTGNDSLLNELFFNEFSNLIKRFGKPFMTYQEGDNIEKLYIIPPDKDSILGLIWDDSIFDYKTVFIELLSNKKRMENYIYSFTNCLEIEDRNTECLGESFSAGRVLFISIIFDKDYFLEKFTTF